MPNKLESTIYQATPNETILSATIMPITPPSQLLTLPTSPSKTSFIYNVMIGTEISNDLLKSFAELFSTNYGIWGEKASTVSKCTTQGP